MYRRFAPILAAVVTSMLIGGLAWAASGDPTTSSSPSTSSAASVPSTDGPVTGVFEFGAGAAGEVTVSSDGAALTIDSVATNTGWTAEIEVSTGREVEVNFRSGQDRIDFDAELEDGAIRVRVRDRATGDETEFVAGTGDSTDASSPTSPDGTSPDATTPDTTATVPGGTQPTTPVPEETTTTVDDGASSTTQPDQPTSTTQPDSPSTTQPDGSTSTTTPDDTTSTTIDDSSSTTVPDDDSDDDNNSADGSYTFPVANAGSVSVTVSGGVLHLNSVSEHEGWRATVEKNEADRIRVEFDNGDDDVEIDIRLDDGELDVEVD